MPNTTLYQFCGLKLPRGRHLTSSWMLASDQSILAVLECCKSGSVVDSFLDNIQSSCILSSRVKVSGLCRIDPVVFYPLGMVQMEKSWAMRVLGIHMES